MHDATVHGSMVKDYKAAKEAYDRFHCEQAQKQKQAAEASATRAASAAASSASSDTDSVKTAPRNLTQQIMQRPPISRPGSSGVLGNIFQGFVRENNALASQTASGASTPTNDRKTPSWSEETDINIIRGWF